MFKYSILTVYQFQFLFQRPSQGHGRPCLQHPHLRQAYLSYGNSTSVENNWSFAAVVREKACFTHNMDHFGRDVREKRFSAHDTHGLEIDLETLTEKLTIEWGK